MDIMIVPLPLFDRNMTVEAYLLNYQKGNDFLTVKDSESDSDDCDSSPALDTLDSVGIDAFTIDQPVFVPISAKMLLEDLPARCAHPSNRVVFLVNIDAPPEEQYFEAIRELHSQGFRIAYRAVSDMTENAAWLALGDYIIINVAKNSESDVDAKLKIISAAFRNLTVVASGVATPDMLPGLYERGFKLFEGNFYRVPVSRDNNKASPLQMNLIRLINLVRDDSFEFKDVAETVRNDTALSVSLMRLINSPYIGLRQRVKNIQHAVIILGQREVRKWVTTSVARLLGADVPSEITKLSLTRAKLCENLAPLFDLQKESASVFMMGLFSVLDVILGVDVESAFEMVHVSADVQQALVEKKGRYAPLWEFMLAYESANWPEVSRQMIMHNFSLAQVYDTYVDAISWYSDLVLGEVYDGTGL